MSTKPSGPETSLCLEDDQRPEQDKQRLTDRRETNKTTQLTDLDLEYFAFVWINVEKARKSTCMNRDVVTAASDSLRPDINNLTVQHVYLQPTMLLLYRIFTDS